MAGIFRTPKKHAKESNKNVEEEKEISLVAGLQEEAIQAPAKQNKRADEGFRKTRLSPRISTQSKEIRKEAKLKKIISPKKQRSRKSTIINQLDDPMFGVVDNIFRQNSIAESQPFEIQPV